MPVVKCSRMKLNKAQVLYISSHIISHGNTVTCCDSRIRCIFVNSSDSACSHYKKMTVCGTVAAVLQKMYRKSCFSLHCLTHKSIFRNSNIRKRLYFQNEFIYNLGTRGIFVVEYTVSAVSSLKSTVKCSVRITVKFHSKLYNIFNIIRRFTDENMKCLAVIFKPACN